MSTRSCNAQIVKLILTNSYAGAGTEDDPGRRVYQLHTLKGDVVAAFDSHEHEDTGVGESYTALACLWMSEGAAP